MTDSWDDMRRAKEEEYFNRQNQSALTRIQKNRPAGTVRPCPVNGKPMKQVTHLGVNIDICDDCGGVWLDKGELEVMLQASKDAPQIEGGFVANLLKKLTGK